MSRHGELLIAVGIVGLAAAGCRPADNTTITPVPVVHTAEPTVLPVKYYPEITQYYPEVGNLPVSESEEFISPLGNTIRTFSLSASNFDENAIKQMFTYIDNLVKKGIPAVIHTSDGRNLQFQVVPRPTHSTKLFIANGNNPYPSWDTNRTPAGTYLDYKSGLNLSHVNIPTSNQASPRDINAFRTTVNLANYQLDTEIFNNEGAVYLPSPNDEKLALDDVSISVAAAVAMRQIGTSYKDYSDYMRIGGGINTPYGGAGFIILPPNQYEEIPQLPLILK